MADISGTRSPSAQPSDADATAGSEPSSWLPELSTPMQAVRELGEAQTAMAARLARRMGMNTTDMRALSLLDAHGPMGLTELARHLELRPASVTSLTDRLEAAELIERRREGDDRRRVTVRARPEAQELSYRTWAPVLHAMNDVGLDLSEDDKRVVCSYLGELVAVMRAAASE